MARDLATRCSFLIAAALIAAAVGDPVVESIANTGVLGGHYADHNHLSVLPALFAGLAFALALVVWRCLSVWHATSGSRDWLIDMATACSERACATDVVCAFVMQLVALFLMESAEQLALGGKLLGGTAWLGGPIGFSLIVHALIGAACLFALGAFMRALVRTFASFVRALVRFVWLSIVRPLVFARFGRDEASRPASGTLRVRQIGGRAPPLLITQA